MKKMKKFHLTISHECDIEGTDEEDAMERWWDKLAFGNETAETLVSDSMTIQERKACTNCGGQFLQDEGTLMAHCPVCRHEDDQEKTNNEFTTLANTNRDWEI
jgi:predicted Zn-ribbon and HTH transcriptional regulator